ncbi:MAG: ankyrin repeat domain-containing protein [Rhodospirillaceae bacterium]
MCQQPFDAAQKGNLQKIAELVSNCANVNASNSDGETPLHWAAINARATTVKILERAAENVPTAPSM